MTDILLFESCDYGGQEQYPSDYQCAGKAASGYHQAHESNREYDVEVALSGFGTEPLELQLLRQFLRKCGLSVLQCLHRPCQVHYHEYFHEFIYVQLQTEDFDDAPC